LKFVGLFEKDGSVKEKRREQVEKLESDINGVIALGQTLCVNERLFYARTKNFQK